MPLWERIGWALLIVVVDLFVWFVPLAAIAIAGVLIARPRFAKSFLDAVYAPREECPSPPS